MTPNAPPTLAGDLWQNDVDELRRVIADRDRLARENAELSGALAQLVGVASELDEARAELDDMRTAWAILDEPDAKLHRAHTATEAATQFRARLVAARAELDELALAVGLGEHPAGQGHVARASGKEMAKRWRADVDELIKVRAESAARIATLEAALSDALFAADHLGDELNDMDVAGEHPDFEKVSAAMNRARAALDGGKT